MNWGQVTPYYAGPRRVVIVDKLRHEVIQVPLAEDYELAQALNGKFRDELLNGELFLGLADARWVIDR